MSTDSSTEDPINYHDDNRVLRYLLHNVKGISPVSGGVLGEALENEYETAEEDAQTGQDLDFDLDV
jgi:hypothetical protein